MFADGTLLDVFTSLTLIGLAADHAFTGSIGVLVPYRGLAMLNRLFGSDIPAEPRYALLLRPWGALGIFAAFVGILPLLDPVRFKPVLFGLIGLLILRIYVRVTSAREASHALALSVRRNTLHIALIALCATILSVKVWTL